MNLEGEEDGLEGSETMMAGDEGILVDETSFLSEESILEAGEEGVEEECGVAAGDEQGVIEGMKGVVEVGEVRVESNQIVDLHEIVSGATMTVLGDVEVHAPELSDEMMINTADPLQMVAGKHFFHQINFTFWQFRESGLFTDIILVCQVRLDIL